MKAALSRIDPPHPHPLMLWLENMISGQKKTNKKKQEGTF